MACRLIGDKQLSEPVMTQFTDAYVKHRLLYFDAMVEYGSWQ